MHKYLIFISAIILLASCSSKEAVKTQQVVEQKAETVLSDNSEKCQEGFLPAPEWSKNAVLYEVNVRQYSKAGTFKAVENDLDRLQEMGIDILWLMPIHPIGEKERKGTEGSYYSVKDYRDVDPSYGTIEDLKSLVNATHNRNMYLIIDWVANHSSWDNYLIKEHPEWYTLKDGKMVPPVDDWSDVADLNFEEEGLQNYMADAMDFWVKECNIDGFRCDVAEMVPMEFWTKVKKQLDKTKQVFMLAEGENPELHQHGFHMTYSWEFHHLMNKVAKGEKNANDIRAYFYRSDEKYNDCDYRLNFTSNHDENSWNGTVFERMGDAAECFAALSYAVPGMPLIYSGQEAPLKKRLEFFEKDVIDWNGYSWAPNYKLWNRLKHEHKAMWNGEYGGEIEFVDCTKSDKVLLFKRISGDDVVFGMFNLSNERQIIETKDPTLDLKMGQNRFDLEPWQYYIFAD